MGASAGGRVARIVAALVLFTLGVVFPANPVAAETGG
jgi:hypothetical protein